MHREILIVEDDPDLRDALAEMFAFAGYVVITAANGAEGLDSLYAHRPGVVLLDMMMPVMGGSEFLARKRIQPEISNTPVIVASASISANTPVPGTAAVLAKPYDVNELLGTVARVFRATSLRQAHAPNAEHREQVN